MRPERPTDRAGMSRERATQSSSLKDRPTERRTDGQTDGRTAITQNIPTHAHHRRCGVFSFLATGLSLSLFRRTTDSHCRRCGAAVRRNVPPCDAYADVLHSQDAIQRAVPCGAVRHRMSVTVYDKAASTTLLLRWPTVAKTRSEFRTINQGQFLVAYQNLTGRGC